MRVITKISELRRELKNSAKKIALVPTMGALHEGHLALVKTAQELAEIVVVSIFVNKTQFNDVSDYEKYPRQNESDLKKLEKSGVNYVFLPDEEEIFGDDFSLKIIPTKMVDSLCGAARQGHFEGVALIVTKLFNIVKPQVAIFGQKDFQQLQIIKKLVKDLNLEIEIFSHPIIRSQSGLAMSSRNQRLSESLLIKAANIFHILSEIKNYIIKNPQNIEEILEKKRQELLEIGFGKIDYLEVRQEDDLKLITDLKSGCLARIFIAVYLDGIRLIDNIELS